MKKSFLTLGWVLAFALLLGAASTLTDLATQVKGHLLMANIPAGGSSATYLRGDGSWANPPGSPEPGPDLLATGGVTVTSFANECAAILSSSGGVLSPAAVPILQTIDATTGIVHDMECRSNAGSIVFPIASGYSFGNALSSGNKNFEMATKSDIGRNGITLTNLSATNRGNSIQWRSGAGGCCGTDFTFFSDSSGTGYEDITLLAGNNITNFYLTGNCPVGCPVLFGPLTGTNGTKQFLFSDGAREATTNPEFGLVNSHLAHGTNANNADNWDTLTCSGSVATKTFTTPFSNATYKVMLTDQTTAGGARVTAKATGSFTIACTGASDSVDYLVMGNPY